MSFLDSANAAIGALNQGLTARTQGRFDAAIANDAEKYGTNQNTALGAYGGVVFQVSSFKVLTFDDFKRETKAGFAEHKLINQPAILEFTGRELEEISFTMTFLSALNVNPFDEIQKLRNMAKKSEYNFLIIGNHAYGENPWVITDLSESITDWTKDGKPLNAKATVNLKEYVEFYQ